MWECGSLGESGALSGDISLNIYGCCWKSLQSCPTLCDPIDGSPSGSPIPGILQARILEWVAISFWLLYWTTQRQVQCGWNLDWQKADWRRGKSDEVLNDDNVAKMAGYQEPELTFSHGLTKVTTIYRANIANDDLKTSRKDFPSLTV